MSADTPESEGEDVESSEGAGAADGADEAEDADEPDGAERTEEAEDAERADEAESAEETGETGSAEAAEGSGSDPEDLPLLLERVREGVDAVKRAVVEGETGDLLELADDLWEVLDELEDVLRTIDFEQLPEAIDVEELPDAVDVEDIPEGLFDEDESAVDLRDLRDAVNLRELWRAVDLLALRDEKQDLEAAVDDLSDDDDEADGEDDDLIENPIGTGEGARVQFGAEARRAVIEEKVHSAVGTFRDALLATHSGLRRIYEANQEKLGQSGHQPDSLNPTAASTMPPGPLPNSASSRASTVPAQVKYSKVEPHRRIYGRRFAEVRDRETDDADDNASDAADADGTDEEVSSDR
ncbi:hypothetical protein BRC97_11015 [Halobacteriales archaeon QS_6_71_20]|nr:MAG: hypothetical protein BRC97_11015 [Halobacteriales archaeon QS_6_71_20]